MLGALSRILPASLLISSPCSLWLLPNESSAMGNLEAFKQMCTKRAPAAHTRLCQCPSYGRDAPSTRAVTMPGEAGKACAPSVISTAQKAERIPHRGDPETGLEASPRCFSSVLALSTSWEMLDQPLVSVWRLEMYSEATLGPQSWDVNSKLDRDSMAH